MAYEIDKNDSYSGINDFIKKSLISTLEDGTYFELNQQALTALDIIPKLKPDGSPEPSTNANVSSRSNATLFAVLNKCRTVSGQRLLATWLKHPLLSKAKIDTRLDIVEHFVKNNELRTICYDDFLRKLPDLLRLSFKISKEKCDLTDLVKIYRSYESAQTLCKSFNHIINTSFKDTCDSVKKLFNWLDTACKDLNEFTTILDESIDLNSIDLSGDYMLKPKADDEIARLTLQLQSLCDRARKELNEVAYDIGLEADKGVKLETDSEKGFGFRVTKNTEQTIRDNSEYFQLSTVKKDGYRFSNKALQKLSNKYVQAKEEYDVASKSVIQDIVSKATMFECEVLELGMALTVIDVFVSLSISAVQNNYIRPLILDKDGGKISIERLRHPCIENQPDVENYVPNDIDMNKDGKKFFLVTGPNMGGKSTYIKSVAIGVIMAQCGSMIPAEDGRISVVDGVYTRVGAGDKQAEGISTFMEEMLDMSTILKSATENSIVIIDELGRGTSTFDGFGLAWSISKHLATKTRCYTIFATHFHELTEMEEEVPIVGNLHVKAICSRDKMTMLYSIDTGVCDDSYGINVAKYTKFPDHVIEIAKERLKKFEEVPGFGSKSEVREFVRDCVKIHMSDS